jgi:hypothetical protein
MWNPIVLLTVGIVLSVILLIGAAVLGIDKGVLSNMGRPEYARGVITYLFAIVTIGTAAVLVLSSLTTATVNGEDKQFQQAKEVLSLLLGIFGTMVGYYFGSEASTRGGRTNAVPLAVSTLDVHPNPTQAGGKITVRGFVSGGTPPYDYGVAIGSIPADARERMNDNGWIVKELSLDCGFAGSSGFVGVTVKDASGNRIDNATSFGVTKPV